MDLSHSSGDSTPSTPSPYAHIRCALGVRLTADQLELLAQAFAESDVLFVKREFRSGYSGAVVLLVSLGANQAPLVVKLAHPFDLEREYQAYQQFVRQISPQNIAHLRGAPQLGTGGQLGLIQYSFAGGESHQAAASLKDYYEANGGAASATILNRIFRAYGRYWWANNRPELYTLGEQYDRLLPVHLQVAKITSATTPAHLLEPGKTSLLTVRQLQVGETLRLFAFQVMKVQAEGREITLVAPPPPNEASAILRIRLELNEGEEPALQVRPGDTIEQVDVVITATRHTLLCAAATEAAPSFDPKIEAFTLDIGGETHERSPRAVAGNLKLVNPLFDLSGLLDQVVETKFSTIHGDLNLQNVLVDMPTGFAWLVDFSETRSGPTLLDPQRLEIQAITILLPDALRDSGLKPVEVAKLLHHLHADPLPSTPPHPALLEPFQFLVTIRRIARQYLIDDLDWDEYYRGMIVALVGALKYKELDASARTMALTAAATLQGLLGHRIEVNQPAPLPPPSSSRPAYPAIGWAALSVGVVILIVVLITLWQGWPGPAVPQAKPTPAPTVAIENIFPLPAGRTIVQGRKYHSESGDHYLIFQPDGNVAVYTAANQYVWDIGSETNRYAEAQSVQMQSDGNFVVRGANDDYIWSALHENPDPSAFLTLTPEGVLQLVSGNTGAILWASDGDLSAATPAATIGTELEWQATLDLTHTDIADSVAWSLDGSKLASASGDQTVRMWDVGAK